MEPLGRLLFSFLFNFFVAFIIVRWIYYPKTKDREYVFTFLTFNTIIFFVLSLLGSINLSVGFGFGLFGIFSVLRYRTDPIPIREMTYLFVTIALPVMNSILVSDDGFSQVLLANLLIVLILFAVERGWGFKFVSHKTILYEKIEMIKPENEQLLWEDLTERTGLKITGVKIGQIDLLHDTAKLEISYLEDGGGA